MEPNPLNKEQCLYLRFLLDTFREKNEWPTVRQVDRFFTRQHTDLDIEDI